MTITSHKTGGERYIEAIGRRKTAIARVRITPSSKMSYEINNKNLEDYFPIKELRMNVEEAFNTSKLSTTKFKVTVKVFGGGISGHADAIKLGIARALIEYDKEL